MYCYIHQREIILCMYLDDYTKQLGSEVTACTVYL